MSLVEQARTVRQRIEARLRELEPLVREYNELKQLAAEMGIEGTDPPPSGGSAAASSESAATGGRRPRAAPRRKAASEPAAGRPAGDIAERMVEAVRAQPGKTVADYAEILNLSASALYRPVRQLTSDGVLVKRARQLFPASSL